MNLHAPHYDCFVIPIKPGLKFNLGIIPADVGFGHLAADLVFKLLGRSLHKIGGRGNQRPADAAVQTQFDTAHSIDDHAGRIGRIPHFQLGFQIQRHLAKGGAFHADVAPFAIGQPGHVVAWTNVDIAFGQFVRQHAGDGAGLGNLLGFQAFAFEHVHEIGVAAEIKLVGVIEAHAAVNGKNFMLSPSLLFLRT